MAFLDFITRPIRGIGRLARGRVRDALGDFAAGAKVAAPFIPGAGIPLQLAIGAGAGALEAGTQQGANFGDVVGGAAGGAANVGIGKLARGVLRSPSALPSAADDLPGTWSEIMAPVPPPAAAPTMVHTAGGNGIGRIAGNIGGGLERAGAGIARFARGNPELASNIAGTALETYGALQAGRADDRRLDLYEEEMRHRMKPRMPINEWRRTRGN